ncbi:MAG: hypothetical protein DRH07_04770 [Deltaproteobacteria bacterium]|nr:MAG: hypothetical protein DRH07_04770 [Deltaproteobacteria bacterium]
MLKTLKCFLCCFLLVICLQQVHIVPVRAGEKEERIKLLQEKMKKLQDLLVLMEEQKLREQPPTEKPWQPIIKSGEERPAYDQYAYLLAPRMLAADLDGVLQQLKYLSDQDPLKERRTLFIIPALPLADGEKMAVDKYNRDLVDDFLKKIGIPTALEGGLLLAPNPLGRKGVAEGPLLFINLTGCNQIVRARIFGLLQSQRLFTEDGSLHGYVWALLKSAAPQAFNLYMENNLTWLSVDN